MNYAIFSHDAFGRFSIVRRIEQVTDSHTCANCGRKGMRLASGLCRLFQYGTLKDDRLNGRPDWDAKKFCSKSCRDSYHG